MTDAAYARPPASVLFDLDGTLVDTAPDFVHCLNIQRQRHRLDPLPALTIRAVVSDGAPGLIRLGFDLEPEHPNYAERHSELLELYSEHLAVESRLFEGMDEVLGWLEERRIPWGVVTNKPSTFTLPLMDRLQLSARCSATVCPDHVQQRKPHPESLFLAAHQLGVSPGDSIYVGDHLRDIDAGRAAGMTTVAARYGYIGDPESVTRWQASHIIDHSNELLALLRPGS